jgi:hypothetical protein
LSRFASFRRRALAVLLLALAAPVAQAGPRLFVDLDYEPDSTLGDCPSEPAFRAVIRDQLGYDPFRADSPQTIVARAHAAAQGLRGSIEWRDASGALRGERALSAEHSDCEAFARVMAFAIAVQIQLLSGEADTATTPPAPASDTDRSSVPAVTPAKNPAVAQDRGPSPALTSREPAAWELLLGVGPTLGFGVAPATVVEGRAFGTLRHAWFALEIGGEGSVPSRHTTTEGNGVEQQLLLGSLAGCLALPPLSGCLVGKVGRLHVRGFGVDAPLSASGVLAQIGPRLALGGEIGSRLAAALRLEALATLIPSGVTLNHREIWRTPAVSLSVGADLAIIFRNKPQPLRTIP